MPIYSTFRSPPQPMWDFTIHPPWGPAPSLAHRPEPGSDTICNIPAPRSRNCPLWGIFTLTVLKRRGGGIQAYIAPFVLLPNRCGTLQSTPLGAQRPRWHTDSSLDLIPSVTSQRLALEIVRFGESSPLTVLKRVERGRYPGLYIAPFVLLPSRCGTLQT